MPKGAEKFIQSVAREAGAAVLKRFGKDGVHYAKSSHAWDVVTKADLMSEKLIMSRIKKKYPTHGIVSEESGKYHEDAEYVWVIDPIDGTMNFSRGVPLFGVMVCLTRRGKVILSAICMPASGELFFAKAGGGAYCNGRRVRRSSHRVLNHSVGCGSSSFGPRSKKFMKRILDANTPTQHIHLISAGSMATNACYAASGRRDWFFAMSGRVWDFAPAYLILKEAGCTVTDMSGKPWRYGVNEFVAANPALHKKLLKLTRGL